MEPIIDADVSILVTYRKMHIPDGPGYEEKYHFTFYGSSFITDNNGVKPAEVDKETETVIITKMNPDAYAMKRSGWGLFRDRRSEKYDRLFTLECEKTGDL